MLAGLVLVLLAADTGIHPNELEPWLTVSAVAMFLGGLVWCAQRTLRSVSDANARAEEVASGLRAIVDASEDAIIGRTLDGTIISWNTSAEQLYGYRAAEVIGRPISLLIPPSRREETAAAMRRLRKTGRIRQYATVRVHKNGQVINVWQTVSPVKDAAGNTVAFLSLARAMTNISGEDELQREQVQKMEAVGELAGGVAHDFNNWLTAIRGYTETILDELDEADPTRRLVEGIRGAAEGAASLTRQLLAFGRRQILMPRVLSLETVVLDSADMIRSVIGEGIELAIVTAPGLGQVKVDDGQIRQVLLNLVINARDAMPEGGSLSIELRNAELQEEDGIAEFGCAPGPYVSLTVTDTGVGMTPDVASRIFEPFFTTKEAGHGTGLGLSSVYGIVKQSSGFIWVDTKEGEGSTFTILLPRVDEATPAPAPSDRRSKTRGGRETILVVEDMDEVREVVASALESKGYGVLAAGSADEAIRLSRLHDGSIDLLLTDVVMPEQNGVQLARKITAAHPETKVLYMSGYADQEIISQGVLDLNLALLPKPFGSDELATKVREVLD
jgi:two-component system cell cycle sensor histidine kinase/response regulator CckA